MKTKAFITTVLICSFVIFLAAAIADMSGKWTGSLKGPDGNDIDLTYTIKVEGDKLTGKALSQGIELNIDSGKVNGSDMTFSVTNPEGVTIPHIGRYFTDGDSISMNIQYQDMKFHTTLTRAVDK